MHLALLHGPDYPGPSACRSLARLFRNREFDGNLAIVPTHKTAGGDTRMDQLGKEQPNISESNCDVETRSGSKEDVGIREENSIDWTYYDKYTKPT
jgi:hypothetical protein